MYLKRPNIVVAWVNDIPFEQKQINDFNILCPIGKIRSCKKYAVRQ